MPRISEKPLTRICVMIFKESDDYLEEMAAKGGVGKAHIIREALRGFVAIQRDRDRQKIDSLDLSKAEPDISDIIDRISLSERTENV